MLFQSILFVMFLNIDEENEDSLFSFIQKIFLNIDEEEEEEEFNDNEDDEKKKHNFIL